MSLSPDPGFDLDAPALIDALDDVPLWSAPFGLGLLDCVRLRRGTRALDVGCGVGFPAIELAQRLGATREGEVALTVPWVCIECRKPDESETP